MTGLHQVCRHSGPHASDSDEPNTGRHVVSSFEDRQYGRRLPERWRTATLHIPMPTAQNLFSKVWQRHLVRSTPGEPDLLFVDLHLVHEVTSPQAFDALRLAGRTVRRPDLSLATIDHGVPTLGRELGISDPLSKRQIDALVANCAEFGITLYGLDDPRQGIVHVIGPEQGITQPGMVIVCGDSHTATHGAFGALAFGIGTSEVEHVLATQTLPQVLPKSMAITVDGTLPYGVTAKDLILGIIAHIGVGGGIGHVVEYRGEAIRALSMEGRMTICNMSIEAGARAGMIAPDDTTFAYLEGRPRAPQVPIGRGRSTSGASLPSDEDAEFDSEIVIEATEPGALRLLGHQPGADRAGDRFGPRSRGDGESPGARRRRQSPRLHGSRGGDARSVTSDSTASSSVRAPTGGSRTSAPPPRSSRGTRCTPRSRRWSCPGPGW